MLTFILLWSTFSGVFVRGCYHADECATTDDKAHYVRNDYYCGNGIGGDSPGCTNPTDDTMDCTYGTTPALLPDGTSGTPGGAVGLTSKTTGVFRKLLFLLISRLRN